MPPEVPTLDAAAARERAADPAEEPTEETGEETGPQMVIATTAFIVMWINGQVIVTADLNAPIAIDHYPTADEITGAAANLLQDRSAEKVASLAAGATAQATFDLLQEKQREAVEKLEEARSKALGEQLMARERTGR
jgi:hypothetical protein